VIDVTILSAAGPPTTPGMGDGPTRSPAHLPSAGSDQAAR
jgi:hypothetical protein